MPCPVQGSWLRGIDLLLSMESAECAGNRGAIIRVRLRCSMTLLDFSSNGGLGEGSEASLPGSSLVPVNKEPEAEF